MKRLFALLSVIGVFAAALLLATVAYGEAGLGNKIFLPMVINPKRPIEKIVFQVYGDLSYEIYTVNLDGTELTRLTNNPAWDYQPKWSPDNSKIAFVSSRDDLNGDIYIMNKDGSNVQRLTNNPSYDAYPTWSPDGSKILFSSNRGGTVDLYVMNSDGSGVSRLTDAVKNDEQADWSPDGTKVVFYSDRFTMSPLVLPGIFIMKMDGTGLDEINANLHASYPRWSPDGKNILMADGQSVNGMITDQLISFNVGTRTFKHLTDTSSENTSPTWCSKGAMIAFVSDRDGTSELYTMNADGSNQVRITTNKIEESSPDCTH